MKKNIIKLLAILAMCFMVVCVLASCNEAEQPATQNSEKNDQPQQTVTPEMYIKDGTYWVGDFNTGLSANDENRELCPSHDDPAHEWHHICTVQEHTQDGAPEIIFYGCLDCNYAKTEEYGHSFEKVGTYAANCTDYGYELYACRCGLTEERNIQPALGHNFPTFNANNVNTAVWVQVNSMTAADCPCEFVPEYQATCSRCPETTEVMTGVAFGHSYTDFHPALPDVNLSPCLQASYEIAKCDNCNHASNIAEHAGCVNHAFYQETAPAPGHQWSQWTIVGSHPTEAAGADIIRTCGRAGCGMHEDATLPALTDASVWNCVTVPASCIDNGTRTYTTTKDSTNFRYVVEFEDDNYGHKINGANVDITAPTTTTAGRAVVTCPDCGQQIVYTLPAIPTAAAYIAGATNGYTIIEGDCADPTVTFQLTLAGANIYVGNSVVAEFTITDQAYHPHAVSANVADCIIAKDENGVESYFALCQNSDGCHQWIYVGPVN